MSAKRISRQSAKKPTRGIVDRERLRNMTEEEIMRNSPPELVDIPEAFFTDAVLVYPESKSAISLRVDRDVLDWFRAQGPLYQSRMNAVLRSYMEQTRKPLKAKRARSR